MARRRRYWSSWDHYYPTAKPIEVKNGIKTKKKRGAIGETWWSKRWISVLESFNMGARLTRGRSYARKGQVVSIEIDTGSVDAKVQGTRRKPYDVTIELKPLSKKDWSNVTDVMASRAIFAAKLLSGEMPKNIEEAFEDAKASLFPTSKGELDTDCSCPDWANPCKHIAAVYYLLAERFDEDPFLIFKLRGRTKREIITALRKKRASTEPEESPVLSVEDVSGSGETVVPLKECIDTFWQAGDVLKNFSVKPSRPKVEHVVLKRLGDAPFNIRKKNITSLLKKAYDAASGQAMRKAAGENPSEKLPVETPAEAGNEAGNEVGNAFEAAPSRTAADDQVGIRGKTVFSEGAGDPLQRRFNFLLALFKNDGMSLAGLSGQYSMKIKTIRKDIGILKKQGLVIFEGPRKTGKYVLSEKGRKMLDMMG